jgi:hypothetical protein
MGPSADTYETTLPEYKYQRVMDRHDDLRYDERYPSFVAGISTLLAPQSRLGSALIAP